MAHSVEKGSQIAKQGFQAEHWVANTFNQWHSSILAQKWLLAMDYVISEIEKVEAQVLRLKDCKTDIVVEVKITFKNCLDVENIQVKLVSNKRGFNQIDKRSLRNYKEKLWQDMPNEVYKLLQYFCGEIKPYKEGRDIKKHRMFIDEFSPYEQYILINWFSKRKNFIISDVIRGRGRFAAEWIMVIQFIDGIFTNWCIANVNLVVEYMGEGNVEISPRGSLKIGRITMQRKGGDNGRESANYLQFKEDPMEILEYFKNKKQNIKTPMQQIYANNNYVALKK